MDDADFVRVRTTVWELAAPVTIMYEIDGIDGETIGTSQPFNTHPEQDTMMVEMVIKHRRMVNKEEYEAWRDGLAPLPERWQSIEETVTIRATLHGIYPDLPLPQHSLLITDGEGTRYLADHSILRNVRSVSEPGTVAEIFEWVPVGISGDDHPVTVVVPT